MFQMRKHLYNRPLSSFPYMPINFFTYYFRHTYSVFRISRYVITIF